MPVLHLHTHGLMQLTYIYSLTLFFTTLRNQDKKVAFIQFDEYGALAGSSKFMIICHNMNIIVQTTGGYAYYLNGKSP